MTTKLTTVLVTAALTTATVIPTVGTIATVTITAVATATVTTATVTTAVVTTTAVTTDAVMASAEPIGLATSTVTSADLREPRGDPRGTLARFWGRREYPDVSVRAQNDPKKGTRMVPNKSSVNK